MSKEPMTQADDNAAEIENLHDRIDMLEERLNDRFRELERRIREASDPW